MNAKIIVVILIVLAKGDGLYCQQNSSIFLFDFSMADGKMVLNNPKCLTKDFIGYNNQPFFMDENNLFFSSNYKNNKFTDLFQINLSKNTIKPFTETDSVSEYSPALSIDKKAIYTVRIEKDGKTQTLWKYPIDKSRQGKRLFDDLKNIGYFTFINKTRCALFLVTEPVSLMIIDLEKNIRETLLTDIGRCLKKDTKGNLLLTQKEEGKWILKRIGNKGIETIGDIPSQDFEYTSGGQIISSKESKLVLLDQKNMEWISIGDMLNYGIDNISRIASCKNHLAIVTNN